MIDAKISFKENPSRQYSLSAGKTLVGRAPECDIVIKDRYVSRKQVFITIVGSRALIENIGSNPVMVSGRSLPAGSSMELSEKEELTLGKTNLIFSFEKKEQNSKKKFSISNELEQKTVLLSSSFEPERPHLVISGPDGTSNITYLEKASVVIGRAPDSDIILSHKTVSRHHALIEKRMDGFYIRPLKPTNPIEINGEKTQEAKLYAGDQIKIGTYFLTFHSDEQRDLRRHDTGPTLPRKSTAVLWTLFGIIILCICTYLFYFYAYKPWYFRQELKKAQTSIKFGKYEQARSTLENMLRSGIPPKYQGQVLKILANSTIAQADMLFSNGDPEGAEAVATAFLKRHGTDSGSQPVWQKLDQYRMGVAQKLQQQGLYLDAMKKYSTIEKDSPYFQEAQKQIRRIWIDYQKERLKKQTIYQLLEQAEQAFKLGHYLTPINRNAFACYQAILSIDPDYELAKKRIEQIKQILKKRGAQAFAKKDFQLALKYLEQYLLIDPQDEEAKEMEAESREHLYKTGGLSNKIEQERVKKLLQKSGAESPWIMKYLFEEEGSPKNGESPW